MQLPSLMNQTDAGRAALTWAQLGWRVHPVRAGDKRPRWTWKDGATTNARVLARHWAGSPGDMVAIALPRDVCVIDIDERDASPLRAPKLLDQLVADHPELADAPMVNTPSGGVHLWIAVPPTAGVTNSGRGMLTLSM